MYDEAYVEVHKGKFFVVVRKEQQDGAIYLHTSFSALEDAETCKRLLEYIKKEWTDVHP